MTTKRTPTTPGQILVGRIIDDMASRHLEPSSKEFELLQLAAGLADQLEGLKATVAADGYTVTLDSGRVVIHPATNMINHTSLALAKVLGSISETDLAGQSAKDPKKVRAGRTRWAAHNAAKANYGAV